MPFCSLTPTHLQAPPPSRKLSQTPGVSCPHLVLPDPFSSTEHFHRRDLTAASQTPRQDGCTEEGLAEGHASPSLVCCSPRWVQSLPPISDYGRVSKGTSLYYRIIFHNNNFQNNFLLLTRRTSQKKLEESDPILPLGLPFCSGMCWWGVVAEIWMMLEKGEALSPWVSCSFQQGPFHSIGWQTLWGCNGYSQLWVKL